MKGPQRSLRIGGVLALTASGALLTALATPSCTPRAAREVSQRRVIILGLDGMDHGLVSEMLAAGQLPNIARLSKMGGFQALGSAIPPQSPVAWSDFITGQDAGGHGIFDFIHRDPKTMTGYLSTSRTVGAERTLRVGRYQIPLSGGKVELLRRGEAFWEALERRGIHTAILRIPANFPPSGTASIELSGMGTPDLLGGYGVFSYYTTDRLELLGKEISGGEVYRVESDNGRVRCTLFGPDNPLLVRPERFRDAEERSKYKTQIPFDVLVDPERPLAKIVIGAEERLLQEGEWSDWVPVVFPLAPTQSVAAQVRFYLRRVHPELALYVSPLNIDPEAPALPISTPASFAARLSRATGRYYTQGMPENTGAFSAGVFSPREFLAQAEIAGREVLDELPYVLSQFKSGLLFYYVGNNDLVSHMMWRPMDPGHPAYDAATDAAFAGTVRKSYRKLDGLVGYTLDHMGPETLLVVMSDHGFTSWRRVFHLNAWLKEKGYLVTQPADPKREHFKEIDFSQTRAYAFGLNGLYLNLAGRERDGIVPTTERARLMAEISQALRSAIDPTTGRPAVAHVYVNEETYADGGQRAIGPDMIVGYTKGTRGSDDAALGGVEGAVLSDNEKPWSGDHCMDMPDVPGILATSRGLRRPVTRLKDLAAAILAEFEIQDFPQRGGTRSGS
jgi:predicted AlkP superfamily phosphohydrolase/phosphomutase